MEVRIERGEGKKGDRGESTHPHAVYEFSRIIQRASVRVL